MIKLPFPAGCTADLGSLSLPFTRPAVRPWIGVRVAQPSCRVRYRPIWRHRSPRGARSCEAEVLCKLDIGPVAVIGFCVSAYTQLYRNCILSRGQC
ncbi:uncharacterized protein BDV14DRAFT_130046 [Aspergillus stella-maris]|uniref:uncharacterized protein n=1 Tax=Aspergillus stella-maris TaxID=1810926 RepID=UPI003CCC90ED